MDVLALSRRADPHATQISSYVDAPAADVLVHLAQESDRAKTEGFGETMVQEALGVTSALARKPYGRIVYASSAVLYGDHGAAPRIATDRVGGAGVYVRVKLESEQAVLASGRGVVARLANIYGPGMSQSNVVSTVLGQVPGEGPVRIMDDAPIRDFLWIQDAASALAAMALSGPVGAYNVGAGLGTSIGDLARLALDVAGQSYRGLVATRPSGRPSCLVLDIQTTTSTWNWNPRIGLREGLEMLIGMKAQ